jgi:hypothetical protein
MCPSPEEHMPQLAPEVEVEVLMAYFPLLLSYKTSIKKKQDATATNCVGSTDC